MSYHLAATITRGIPDLDRLEQIPTSIGFSLIGWNVYAHRQLDVCLLDVFSIRHRTTSALKIEAFPLVDSTVLPSELYTLQSLATFLRQAGKGDGMDLQSVNSSLLLNRILDVPILYVLTGDEDVDFACTVSEGKLLTLSCRCGDLLVSFADLKLHAPRLDFYGGDDEEFVTDMEYLHKRVPENSVSKKNIAFDDTLNANAIKEWRQFSRSDLTALGLGDYDPPEFESEWRLLASSDRQGTIA